MRISPIYLTLTLLLWGLWAPGASAVPLDPTLSGAWVFAPTLAPGTCGRGTIEGEMSGDRFTLHAPLSGLSTGNALYDAVLRHLPLHDVALEGNHMLLIRRTRGYRFYRAQGLVSLGGRPSFELPLFVKVFSARKGNSLFTTLRVPLAPFGVHTLKGGEPGDLSVGLRAFFPGTPD